VSEQPVFWLGGKPGKKDQGRKPPEAERYEPALREVCEACGYAVDEYVAAQGGFGGWLTHLDRDGQRFRLFWNGKAKQLALEHLQDQGGWIELRSAAADDESLPGFVNAVRTILENRPGEG
jgi:hypothetical protein